MQYSSLGRTKDLQSLIIIQAFLYLIFLLIIPKTQFAFFACTVPNILHSY